MKDYDTYIFDIDGTIVREQTEIPGSINTLRTLRDKGKQLLFATNTPLFTKARLVEKLRNIGFAVEVEEIVTPIDALEFYFKEKNITPKLLPIVDVEVCGELQKRGYQLVASTRDECTHVLLGMNKNITYQSYCDALYQLDNGSELLLLNKDLYCPTEDGRVPDSGALSAVLTSCTTKEPEHVGKPTKWMQQAIISRVTSTIATSIFIGDSLTTDIEVGKALGMDTCLVETGVASYQNRVNYESTYVMQSVANILLTQEKGKGECCV
ncbi:HAD-IIA family hydrolase [Bacillus alkalicellulosilyticus]|uniref:HAD-IIA family hydrolase n=1 Tax=Alkalihalobacterium alkalicellulosilyticum TaxID=1912214 RepID=UPI001481F830|nr:HAD-IIA family hydrolase [Bacillus alkalicellulosilyticus]